MSVKFEQPFSPEEELEKLKQAPKEERRERLAEFKEKLAAQKEGIAKMQVELMNAIRANPEMPREEFSRHLEEHGKEIGLADYQKLIARWIFSEYEKKHRAVKEGREKCSDDAELYKAVFGRQPIGKVKITAGPMTLYFRCYDPEDFTYCRAVAGGRSDISSWDRTAASLSAGMKIKKTQMAQFNDITIVENTMMVPPRKRATLATHEEQHVIQEFFHDKFHQSILAGRFKKEKPETEDEAKLLVEQYLREQRKSAESWVKSEILAYLKTGSDPKTVFDRLTKLQKDNGLYDYLEPWRERDIPVLSQKWLLEFQKAVPEAIQKVFINEYRDVIQKGINAFTFLIKKLKYSAEEATALLRTEPLSKWHHVVSRLYAQKQKQ